jgi:predicted transcriptional regulator
VAPYQWLKVLSIKRIYAERLISGTKQIELRKRDLGIRPGTLVLLYETVPDNRIAGAFMAGKTFSYPVTKMWTEYGPVLGINRLDYDSYFTGVEMAFGIRSEGGFTLNTRSYDELQQKFPGFVVPQLTLNWKAEWFVPEDYVRALNEGQERIKKEFVLGDQLSIF